MLFHTPELEAFGTWRVEGHHETWRLRDAAFKRWLASRYYEEFEKAPSSQAVLDALGVLEGNALYKGPQKKVCTRLATRKGAIYLDLCDSSWRCVKITAHGWKIVTKPHVKFRRARGMKSLPVPKRGGSINQLRQFLNVSDDKDFVLMATWLVAGLRPLGPFPVLTLLGEAGSAKSTTARVLRELVDPNITPLRSEPREVRDLMIAAKNSWCVAFDNVSHLPVWLSDALCRLATGGGFATRQLYSDDEEKLFEATRPILLNGIDGVVSRGDLMDRSLITYLPVISDHQRKPEKEFWRLFYQARPRILGALLDAVSCALQRLPKVKLDHLPRMADFAEWAVASESAFGWSEGSFIAAYDSNRSSANNLALEASPIVAPLRRVCARGTWTGTATELLRALNKRADDQNQQRDWPKNGWSLSMHLRRIAPNLRAAGLDVLFGKKTAGEGSKRLITITRTISKQLAEMIDAVEQPKPNPGRIQRFPRYDTSKPPRFPRYRD
jgi:hypothetical protein